MVSRICDDSGDSEPVLMVELTQEQSEVKSGILKDLKAGKKQIFTGGYAGTGKTLLMSDLILELDDGTSNNIYIAAPTGKAAVVLNKKLADNGVRKTAKTIHSVLYQPEKRASEKVRLILTALNARPDDPLLKSELAKAQLSQERIDRYPLKFKPNPDPFMLAVKGKPIYLFIDECSMVAHDTKLKIGELQLNRYDNLQVIFFGDCGQVPPPEGENWFVEGNMNYILQDIHRQAEDSAIIRASMEVREHGRIITNFRTDDFRILPAYSCSDEFMAEQDIIISGKNETRYDINQRIRKYLGYGQNQLDNHLPNRGEKLICIRNKNFINMDDEIENLFINGVICTATAEFKWGGLANDVVIGSIQYDGTEYKDIEIYGYPFKKTYGQGIKFGETDLQTLNQFDYGYCITVHKSQGSEWDNVMIRDDKMQITKREFRKKWLYTAITRAKQRVIYCPQ